LRTGSRQENIEVGADARGQAREGGRIVYGQAVATATQNIGRTGPIVLDGKVGPWALLTVALLWAVISGAVAFLGARQGTHTLAVAWAASCALSSLAAAYFLWRLAWAG
jgi:hypothetical protein